MEEKARKRKEVLFIINPISGTGKQKGIVKQIGDRIDRERFNYRIAETGGPGDATTLSREAAAHGIDYVIAVGGDGTVNEVATGLAGTDTVLGIIPSGSGNGLSRHLKIPMNLRKALDIINREKVMRIDTATLNDHLFVNVAGVGFDANVAKKFANAGKRGFATYFRITREAYKTYKPKKYTLEIDGEVIERRALLVSFANSSQWGNNTSIDPGAKVDDGLIDVCIVQRVPYWKVIFLAPLLFMKRFDRTPYVEIIRAKEVKLIRKKAKTIHLDGDPMKLGKEITMKIQPGSLRVLVP
jgi:YegS/Rv2252/BmrU family lipid kinase